MRRTICVMLSSVLLFVVGCSLKPKMIESDELKKIVEELVFSDVVIGSSPKEFRRDSIRFMEPILSRYGYTVKDLEYTLDKLIQRKSDVLPTLITEVAEEMEKQREHYNQTTKVVGAFDRKADSMTMKRLLFDSLKIKSVKDLERVMRTIPLEESGYVEMVINYMIDTTDLNRTHVAYLRVVDSVRGTKIPPLERFIWYEKSRDGKPKEIRQKMDVDARKYNQLSIELLNLSRYSQKIEKPNVRIDSVKLDFHYDKLKARKMRMDSILKDPILLIIDQIAKKNGTKNSGTLPDIGR